MNDTPIDDRDVSDLDPSVFVERRELARRLRGVLDSALEYMPHCQREMAEAREIAERLERDGPRVYVLMPVKSAGLLPLVGTAASASPPSVRGYCVVDSWLVADPPPAFDAGELAMTQWRLRNAGGR